MDFSRTPKDRRRRFVGIALVVLLHVVVVYALVTGLATRVIEVIHAPVEVRIVKETHKPPPEPKVPVPPPPVLQPPAPVFIPPPEVQIAAPAPLPPPITVTTPTPPPAPVVIAPSPPPPVAVAAPPPPPPPVPVSASVACANYRSVMGEAGFPREAIRQGIEQGDALIEFTLGPNGEVKNVKALRASHPIFARNSIRIVGEYKCSGQGREVIVQVPFGYRLE